MGRALALRQNAELVLDLAWFEQVKASDGALTTHRNFSLDPFMLTAAKQSIGLSSSVASSFWSRLLRKVLRSIPRKCNGLPVFTERGFTFDPLALGLKAPVWLDGYWQSPQYFEDAATQIRAELGSPMHMSNGSRQILQQIVACDAICLHVRRGDYVSNSHAAATHGLCDMDYYRSGIEHVMAGLAKPYCFVFSDDPDWVRANLVLPVPMTVVDVNGPDAAHEDLWLMSSCRRFVIANSSLSWWGAWLGRAEDKIVVAPRRWFLTESHDTRDLIPADWVRL
jgi:hypothetical protein